MPYVPYFAGQASGFMASGGSGILPSGPGPALQGRAQQVVLRVTMGNKSSLCRGDDKGACGMGPDHVLALCIHHLGKTL